MDKLVATVSYEPDGSADGLCRAISTALEQGARSLLIFACEHGSLTPERLDPFLRQLTVPIGGAIFPQIIYCGERKHQGAFVCAFEQTLPIHPVAQLDRLESGNAGGLSIPQDWFEHSRSALVLVDGLARGIDNLTQGLYSHLGGNFPVMGGGAGTLDFIQHPCLFSNRGMLQNAALLIGLSGHLHIGVRHGWQKLAGPFQVTRAEGNILHSLNFRPAFEVYREAVESNGSANFADNDFFSISKTYPFGLEKEGTELLVRDPIQRNGDSLICVGQVPKHSMLYILRGEAEHLLGSAHEAASLVCTESANCHGTILLFDCISRVLFLGDSFRREMEAISTALPKESRLCGALTLGEIASASWGPIEFLNKTTVIGSLN